MEKVTIVKCEKVEGQSFYGATDSNGRKISIWNEDVAKKVIANINIQCSAEIKPVQRGDKTYYNMRDFQPTNITPEMLEDGDIPTQEEYYSGESKSLFKPEIKPEEKLKWKMRLERMSDKDASIVSQVILKCATEMYCNHTSEPIFEDLCDMLVKQYWVNKQKLESR